MRDDPRFGRLLSAMPALALLLIVVCDALLTPGITVLGLAVVAPLLAASVTTPRVTAGYGVAAMITATVLGVYDDAYSSGSALAGQLIRLGFIAVMSVTAVYLARYRMEREKRLSHVTKVAEAAQRAILLPVPPHLGPARVAVHYDSAASDALIGGDMYAMAITRFGLRVLIGDVRGKGLDAVRMSALVIASFRERANDHPDLSVLLRHMDRAVSGSADTDEDFVTALLVQLEDDGRASIAAAGHPYPFLLTQGRVRIMEPPDAQPPLGLGAHADRLTAAKPLWLTLDVGDRLLLYTDGLTETRDPRTGEFFSPHLISGALAGDRELGDILAALREEIHHWSGGQLNDDLAMVLLEYQPEHQPATKPD